MLRSFPRQRHRLSRRNLLTNGDFEVSATGWAAGGSVSLARVTTEHATGAAALRVTATAAASFHEVLSSLASPIAGATAGRRYRVSGWVKGEGTTIGKTYRLRLRESGGAQALALVAPNTDYTMTAGWTFIIASGVIVQNDRTGIDVDHVNPLTPASGEIYYLDGFRIVRET